MHILAQKCRHDKAADCQSIKKCQVKVLLRTLHLYHCDVAQGCMSPPCTYYNSRLTSTGWNVDKSNSGALPVKLTPLPSRTNRVCTPSRWLPGRDHRQPAQVAGIPQKARPAADCQRKAFSAKLPAV